MATKKATKKAAVKKTTSKKKPKAPPKKTAAAGSSSVTIRHYCQGIGDCHLLSFPKDDGSPFYMLIDCGVHSSVTGGSQLIDKIVADIATVTTHIDVLVATHEHWDHNSGFLSAAAGFKKITFDEVWMAWTEDPSDAQARQLDKFKGQALALLQATSQRLAGSAGLSDYLEGVHAGVDALLGFNFGAKGEKVRSAREAAKALATKGVKYLEPTDPPIDINNLSNLRIYVLGPPRDATLIGVTERASEMYSLDSASGSSITTALADALNVAQDDTHDWDACPFDANLGTRLTPLLKSHVVADDDVKTAAFVQDHYAGPAPLQKQPVSRRNAKPDPNKTDQSWRRIDMDWLGVSADVALQLDDRTNNTSLVLAFELTDSKRVLLFAADAQVGNWLSWQTVQWGSGATAVTGPDLLSRTVYYKVGHHGSQNATLKAKGLEMMTSQDLSAFIPTNEKDAKKVRWGQMPFKGILDDLTSRTAGRVVRADDPWVATQAGGVSFNTPNGSIRSVKHSPGLWVEFEVA